MNNIKIACALDDDVYREIMRSQPKSDRGKCDDGVIQALKNLYNEVHLISVVSSLKQVLTTFEQIQPDVVFNLAFSAEMQEPSFAAFLDLAGMAYTGSGPVGIALTNDKVRTRHLLQAANVSVPRFVELPVNKKIPKIDLQPPLIVKPAQFGGCSFGIYLDSVVKTPVAAVNRAKRLWKKFGVNAVCDEFILGRELRIGVVEEDAGSNFRIVGITETIFPKAKPGWGFKSEGMRMNPRVRKAHNVNSVIARLSHKLKEKLHTLVNITMRTLDINGYATLDVRIDDTEQIIVIDVNANPGLSDRSLIWGRPSFAANIRPIVDAALAQRRTN